MQGTAQLRVVSPRSGELSAIQAERHLAALEGAVLSLDEASTLGDALRLNDAAESLRVMLKKAGLELELQNRAAESRLRTQRWLGQMLADNPDLGSGKKNCTLQVLGIEATQSHRWQTAASLPDEAFEQFIAETKEAGKELTAAAVYRLAKQAEAQQTYTADAEYVNQSPDAEVVTDLSALAGRKFKTIYADPPWQYGNQGTRAATDNHYGTMPLADICNMPIAELADDDAHLHLWTTNAFLFDAKQVMEAWGFEYRSCFVWVKPQMGIGNYWRVSHEFLLLGIRGNAKRFRDRSQMSWLELDRTKHSAKPHEVREAIEKVSWGPYLELFGRKAVQGWTVYGNQVESRLFA